MGREIEDAAQALLADSAAEREHARVTESEPETEVSRHAAAGPAALREVVSPNLPSLSFDEGRSVDEGPHPIPWSKFIPLILFRMIDAMLWTTAFPFMADMIGSFGVASDKIGLYAGVAEGAMMVTEAAMATVWAELADKYGRRPCLLWGFAAVLVQATLFGFSSYVWQVIAIRVCLGLGPTAVLPKIMASEISHPTNRAKMFSIFSPCFYFGVSLGTFIGGEFAHPIGRLPWWLGGSSGLWKNYPYALPCVISVAFGAVVLLVGWLCLPETMSSRIEESKADAGSQGGSTMAALRVPQFPLAFGLAGTYQLTMFAWDGMFTVYPFTEVSRGGLGLSIDTIGLIYSFTSIAYVVLVPFVLPWMQQRLGTKITLMIILSGWSALALLMPLVQWSAVHTRGFMWALVVLQQMLKCFASFGLPICDMRVTEAFDSCPHLLAKGTALAFIAGGAGRAVGPMILGWIYSLSTEYATASLGRQISWLSMLGLALVPLLLTTRFRSDRLSEREKAVDYEALPDTPADGRGDDR